MVGESEPEGEPVGEPGSEYEEEEMVGESEPEGGEPEPTNGNEKTVENQVKNVANGLGLTNFFGFGSPEPEPEPEPEAEPSPLLGGYSDSEYESDGSVISSDEEDDIVPYTTAIFDDDDDDEDLMEHVKNMRSKKYLKNLNNIELRDILRKNGQNISRNNNYLTKKQMIKSINQYYK